MHCLVVVLEAIFICVGRTASRFRPSHQTEVSCSLISYFLHWIVKELSVWLSQRDLAKSAGPQPRRDYHTPRRRTGASAASSEGCRAPRTLRHTPTILAPERERGGEVTPGRPTGPSLRAPPLPLPLLLPLPPLGG